MKKDYYEEIESITEDIYELFQEYKIDVKLKNRLYHADRFQVDFFYNQYKCQINFKTSKLDRDITTEKIIKEKNWILTIITDEEEITSEKYNLKKLIQLILSEKVQKILK